MLRLSLTAALLAALVATPALAEEPFVVLEYADGTPGGAAGSSAGGAAGGYTVQRGDTLARILQRELGARGDLRALISQTVALNPHAFVGGNPNRLLAGQRLALPGGGAGASGQAGGNPRDEIYFF